MGWPSAPRIRAVELRRGATARVLAAAALVTAPFVVVPRADSPLLIAPGNADEPTLSVATFAIIFAIVALSFATLLRLSGLPSVAHGALWGLGAYTAAVLAVEVGWGFLETLGPAIVLPALAAVLIAIPAFRTTGVAFLIVSIALGELLVAVFDNAEELTGGPKGLAIVGVVGSIAGLDLNDSLDRYYVCAGFLVVVALLVGAVSVSRFGRTLRAVRDDERLARSVGMDARLVKIAIFAITGAIAGVAGQLYLYQQLVINPPLFGVYAFIPIILMAVVAGADWVGGPIIGAFLITYLPSWGDNAGFGEPNSQQLVFGLALLVIAAFVLGRNPLSWLRTRRTTDPERFAPAPTHSDLPTVATNGEGRRIRPPGGEILLRVEALRRDFEALRALGGVDLDVHEGEVLGIIGPNGSGKTTLFNCITGFVAPTDGTITWEQRVVRRPNPDRLARSGLVRTFQQPHTFGTMTVREHCALVAGRAARHRSRNRLPGDVDGLLEFCHLGALAGVRPRELSYGSLRRLNVAVALAAHPRLLLLDEPAAGLNDREGAELGRLLKRVRDAGVTVVVVDHDMTFLVPICDRIVAMDAGRVLTEGTPSEVLGDPAVVSIYLGHQFAGASK